MSTEIKEIPGLTVVYLRNALNNPAWTTTLDSWIEGCEVLKSIPKLSIPPTLVRDEEIFAWSEAHKATFTLSKAQTNTCVTAIKKAVEGKTLPMNEYSAALIPLFLK